MTDTLPPMAEGFTMGDGPAQESVAFAPEKDDIAGLSVVKHEPGRNGEPVATMCVTCGVNPLPKKGEKGYHPQRKYCGNPCGPPTQKKRRVKVTPSGADELPPSIQNTFNVTIPKPSSSKLDARQSAVEQGFIDMMGLIPMAMAAFGDEVCPPTIKAALPGIAHQVAILSKYHPVLAKIFADGELPGELVAWFGLILATSPAVIAVLAHHELVPPLVAERVAYAAAMGPSVVEAAMTNAAASADAGS